MNRADKMELTSRWQCFVLFLFIVYMAGAAACSLELVLESGINLGNCAVSVCCCGCFLQNINGTFFAFLKKNKFDVCGKKSFNTYTLVAYGTNGIFQDFSQL